MELTWYGLSCFRLAERKQTTIVTDPYNGNLGLPPLKIKADLITVSHQAPGHNCIEAIPGAQRHLTGPGEYEVGGVFITGIATNQDAQTNGNIIYVFDYDGLVVAHLGDMQSVPNQTQIEALEQVNVLLVPVGGGNSLNAAQAAELVSMLEPNIVVPMHYRIPGLNLELDEVDRFFKEMGITEPSEETTLRISSSNLPEETETILLLPKL